jgi:kynurenine formamidase
MFGEVELLMPYHIVEWEKNKGELQAEDIVLIRFGKDLDWHVRPEDSAFIRSWPGVSEDAAKLLADRGIKAVGTDAISIDSSRAKISLAHKVFLSREIPVFENLCKLDSLPPFCFFIALPLKFKDGSGSPVRAVAFVQKIKRSA